MKTWNDDPFTKKARREDFAARSVYKLEEIDRREKILGGADRILDLGASPGSWSQYCLKKNPRCSVFAVDLSPMRVSSSRLHFALENIEKLNWQEFLGEGKVDLVLSDMAPKTSGNSTVDTARSFDLASAAFLSAKQHLKEGGTFVVKLFMGDEFEGFRKSLRESFEEVRLLRPESTRKHSREIYFIAKKFRSLTLG